MIPIYINDNEKINVSRILFAFVFFSTKYFHKLYLYEKIKRQQVIIIIKLAIINNHFGYVLYG